MKAAENFAITAHGEQRYGAYPYSKHLSDVVHVLARFQHVTDEDLLCAAWLHDCVEDTAITKEQVEKNFGQRVAELVWAVTLERGAPRHLALEGVYAKIRVIPGAVLVKLADRIANVEASLEGANEAKLAKYKGEYPRFREALHPIQPKEAMWEHLDEIIHLTALPPQFKLTSPCAACEKTAGELLLISPFSPLNSRWSAGRWSLNITGFLGAQSEFLEPSQAGPLKERLLAGDVAGVCSLNPLWAPFYCPKCRVSYCLRHWTQLVEMDQGFYDQTLGDCPKNHRRKLDD